MAEAELVVDLSETLDSLCRRNARCSSKLHPFLSKQIWSVKDRKCLLDSLALLLFDKESTLDIALSFRVILLDLLYRAKESVGAGGRQEPMASRAIQNRHRLFCIALSRLLDISQDVRAFTLSYLQDSPAFYSMTAKADGEEPVAKKAKKSSLNSTDIDAAALEDVETVFRLMRGLGADFQESVKSFDWVKYINSSDTATRWCAVQSAAILLQMTPHQLHSWIDTLFTEDEQIEMSLRYHLNVDIGSKDLSLPAAVVARPSLTGAGHMSHTIKCIVQSDLHSAIVSIGGILLPVRASNPAAVSPTKLLVAVPTTRRNLRSLGLAVSAGKPALLEGPVGCGKTALVEHLALVTGHCRDGVPQLMKIQLSEDTDSKALLGTYRCTDVPGQFLWQPGCLVTAVTEGRWLLLEDIDYAPMDVVSILIPLLETGSLSVPGHGDFIKAAPDFRIFATQRLVSTASGWHRQQSSGNNLMNKLWTRISISPLTRTELKEILTCRHPQLSSMADRLLDVYFLNSSGNHNVSSDERAVVDDSSSEGKFRKYLAHDCRPTSPRDLFKWANRIAQNYNPDSSSIAELVLIEALDCFCMSIRQTTVRHSLAEAVCAKIGIAKSKVEYFCCRHKPVVKTEADILTVGRVNLNCTLQETVSLRTTGAHNFAFTQPAAALLERIAVCVYNGEPVLLVGETGTGKTSTIQYLSEQMRHPLKVVNMNQQSDCTDLLGGFKPVDVKFMITPFKEDFGSLFYSSFSQQKNSKFLCHVEECALKRRWYDLFRLVEHCCKSATTKFTIDSDVRNKWDEMGRRLAKIELVVKQTRNALAFSFIEGVLVTALKKGEWILLDEINLATAETLECLSGLLDGVTGSVVLTERGDTEPIVRHPDFRLFACMNPATDVGKKDLPLGIRNRFTELFVDELEEVPDIVILVNNYLKGFATSSLVEGIVCFYQAVRSEAASKLVDGTGRRPHYSLRTLCRALRLAARNTNSTSAPRAIYEAFCLSFLTQLSRSSHPIVRKLICQHILAKHNEKALLGTPLEAPSGAGKYIQFEGYWIAMGTLEPCVPPHYIITPGVRANLRDLARVVSAGNFPVLLQGETSVGKTSLITYLARSSGNQCHRINNHEHTDVQEYIGCYTVDEMGKLVFREGVLVEAMRKGYWIILDELNLAPTDVLEALNRLLDDNRELFIAETQEVVCAHPRFMLFATQNPPGLYGGRKVLSRAFRNRFVELHFDEIPSVELQTILHERCGLPPSHCKKLVAIMLELQTIRRSSGLFAGKQGYITLRDLFRWAQRYHLASCTDMIGETGKYFDWDQLLADNGYMLLAGRVRQQEEEQQIIRVIEKHMKRKIVLERLFNLSENTSLTTRAILESLVGSSDCQKGGSLHHLVWTYNMRRMAVLVAQAIKFKEPVLLVGETGCGKTTVCQLYSRLNNLTLYTINCHQHTEASDFIGGLRPIRHRTNTDPENQQYFEWCDGQLVVAMKEGAMFLVDEISLADDSVLERLNSVLEPERKLLLVEMGGGRQLELSDEITAEPSFCIAATMNPGGDYGKKELSPALRNRFTEIWCSAKHDRCDLISIIEHNIVPGIHLRVLGKDQPCIVDSGIGVAMMNFIEWLNSMEFGRRIIVTIRDILSWVMFINETAARTCTVSIPSHDKDLGESSAASMETEDEDFSTRRLDPALSFIHGACLVFIDGLGSGSASVGFDKKTAKNSCLEFLLNEMNSCCVGSTDSLASLGLEFNAENAPKLEHQQIAATNKTFTIYPFSIPRGELSSSSGTNFAFNAPTTFLNAQRVMRALQLSRPILLEGSPGVGKTSLVAALAKAAGHELVRINLSEQTDVTDLFGADLPVEGGKGGEFAWRDGPLLSALKSGHWIVLDELNLASQSVLEGLNSCLDHRAEIFIPELNMTFHIQHKKTRLFACQNPLQEGSGRKGLPKSFLNRFTQVYVEPLTQSDLLYIVRSIYPQLPSDVLEKIVTFNRMMFEETVLKRMWGQKGGPWEFNLRDLFRCCDLMVTNQVAGMFKPLAFVDLIYMQRMRTSKDREIVKAKCIETFGNIESVAESSCEIVITRNHIQVGNSFLRRNLACDWMVSGEIERQPLRLLHHSFEPLSALMTCISMNWLAILIGCSGTGKTSLVKLLAKLTGNVLHVVPMSSAIDTTELLGGFEQADLNRQLEKTSRQIASLAYGIVSQLLMCQSRAVTDAEYLLTKLTASLTSTVESVASNCLEIVQMRIEQLLDLLSNLLSVAAKNLLTLTSVGLNIAQQSNLLASDLLKMKQQLNTDQSLNHGGRFEWTDSVLVKCLQEGNWLLIDNVNFCSASVLDRLNALLEPNGVLTVSERGVIDGCVPSITPHKNFRLIFAMDAHHGEISRAMRNRGVEIYIPNEADDSCYDAHDIRMLLSDMGIIEDAQARALISVHQSVQNGRPVRDGASLIQCAEIVEQQTSRGIEPRVALECALLEVYVYGQTQQQSTAELIASAMSEYSPSSYTCKLLQSKDVAVYSQSIPSIIQWCNLVTIASIQQCTALFVHILESLLSKTVNSECSPGLTSDMTTFVDSVSLLEPCSKIIVESCPVNCGLLVTAYLKRLVERRAMVSTIQNEQFMKLMQLMAGICKGIQTIFSHSAILNLLTLENSILSDEDAQLSKQLPIDWRWCPSFVRKVNVEHSKSGTLPDRASIMADMFAFTNQLYIVQSLCALDTMVQNLVNNSKSDSIGRRWKMSEFSLLQLVQLYQSDQIRLNQLPHSSFEHISSVITSLISEIMKHHEVCHKVSDSEFQQTNERLHWLKRFCEVCSKPIGLQNLHVFVSTVSLHWNWVYEKLVKFLVGVDYRFSKELCNWIEVLNATIGGDAVAFKIQQKMLASHDDSRPYRTEQEATAFLKLRNVCEHFNIWHIESEASSRRVKETVAVKLLLNPTVGKVRDRIVELQKTFNRSHLTVEDLETQVTSLVLKLEVLLSEKGIIKHSDDHDKINSNTSDTLSQSDVANVAMWPLMETFALKHESYIVSSTLTTQAFNSSSIDSYLQFCSRNTTFSMPTLSMFCSTELAFNRKLSGSLVAAHLEHLKGSTAACNNVMKWLNWKEDDVDDNVMAVKIDSSTEAGSLYSWNLSLITLTLLTGNNSAGQTEQKILSPCNVTLYNLSDKLQQIETVSRMLWIHAMELGSQKWDLRDHSRRILGTILHHHLSAVQNFLSDDVRQSLELLLVDESTRTLPEEILNDTCSDAWEKCGVFVLMPRWKNCLKDCLEQLRSYDSVVSVAESSPMCSTVKNDAYFKSLIGLGAAWANIGLIQAHILAPQGPVDPNDRLSIKLQYAREELKEIERELKMRMWNANIQTGRDFDTRHPVVVALLCRQVELKKWLEEMSGKIAYRLESSEFLNMLKDTRQFMSSIGEADKTSTFIKRFVVAYKNGDYQTMCSAVNEGKVYSESCGVFVSNLRRLYPLYTDLLNAFISALLQLQHGIDLMRHATVVRMSHRKLTLLLPCIARISLEDIIISLTTFPLPCTNFESGFELVRHITSDDFVVVLHQLDEALSTSAGHAPYIARVMRCALLHTFNCVASSATLDHSSVAVLNSIFSYFVNAWNKAETERQRKEAEEGSLYRYVTHGDGLTDEEKDQLEIEANFPTYAFDFHDIIVGFTLDDISKSSVTISALHGQSSKDNIMAKAMTQSDMEIVQFVHHSLFTRLTSCHWYQSDSNPPLYAQANLVQPLLLGYEIATDIIRIHFNQLNPEAESNILSSHLLASSVLQNFISIETEHPQTGISSIGLQNFPLRPPYDIYHDANIPEVVQCKPLLEKFIERLHELLFEWPEHPTLMQLMIIVMRVLEFPVTSSLMRFVTGLETLLQKAQEWQVNAASHVSLSTHLDALTQMVIRWRKLELNCWKTCLDSVLYTVQQGASRWWLHLSGILDSNRGVATSDNTDGPFNLLSALRQFMEESNVGEYIMRLNLLLAFHLQLIHSEVSRSGFIHPSDTACILWNIYMYYQQFVPEVQSFLAKSREPIEKQLKDYVKIARWNDANFYAVKEAVGKAHKTLHKHMKEFKTILHSAVRPILTDSSPDWTALAANQEKAVDRTRSIAPPKQFVMELSELNLLQPDAITDTQLHRRAKLMSKYCEEIIVTGSYPSLVDAVDAFTGDVIECIGELQSLGVDHIKDNTKRLTEIKHIAQRKRKALADLFKQLKDMGLSYRKGLGKLSMLENRLLETFVQPSCSVDIAMLQLNSEKADNALVNAWCGCDKYFFRSISRRAMFQAAVQNPSKELGQIVIDRCKGFSEHLMIELEGQRHHFVNQFNAFICYRKLVERIREMTASPTNLPPQSTAKNWLLTLKNCIQDTLQSFSYLKLLLNCAPKTVVDVALLSPMPTSSLSRMAVSSQSDERVISILKSIGDYEIELRLVQNWVNHETTSNRVVTDASVKHIGASFEALRRVINYLMVQEQSFRQSLNSEPSNLTSFISYNVKNVLESCNGFDQFAKNLFSTSTCFSLEEHAAQLDTASDEFTNRVNMVTDKCLKVVEDFLKLARSIAEGKAASSELPSNSPEGMNTINSDGSMEGLLTEKIGINLSHDLNRLSIADISTNLKSLIESVVDWTNQDRCYALVDDAMQKLRARLPIFIQFGQFAKYYLVQQICSLRETGKLLSVLLSLFTSLTLKGFCLPAGISEEMAGEGATEFCDIEGGGIGEGEGIKDVSDQIENEDQVEGCKGDKQQEDQTDKKGEDNAIEMSGDFDGQMQDFDQDNENSDADDSDKEAQDENELDKQLGDVGAESEKLDEKLWGSDDEEEDDTKESQKEEEKGPGAGKHSEPELAPKDDACGSGKKDEKNENEDGSESEEEGRNDENENLDVPQLPQTAEGEEEMQQNAQPPPDQHEEDSAMQDLDLPNDLNLDEQENGAGEERTDDGIKDGDEKGADEDEEEGEGEKDDDGVDNEKQVEEKNKEQKEENKDDGELNTEEPGQDAPNDDKDDSEGKKTEENAVMDTEEIGEDEKADLNAELNKKDENEMDEARKEEEEGGEDAKLEESKLTGKSRDDKMAVQQTEEGSDEATAASETNQDEEQLGSGLTSSEDQQGHTGNSSQKISLGSSGDDKSRVRRRPGQSNEERSVASSLENIERRLKTIDSKTTSDTQNNNNPSDEAVESDLYEHIKDSERHSDAQTLDAATDSQQKHTVADMNKDKEKGGEDDRDEEPVDVKMETDEEFEKLDAEKIPKPANPSSQRTNEQKSGQEEERGDVTVSGERVLTLSAARGNESTIHTALEHFNLNYALQDIKDYTIGLQELEITLLAKLGDADSETLRAIIEMELESISHATNACIGEENREAQLVWQHYESLTAELSQELCEQLRLVLEPTQASKLRGDYRTGKRISMRKVIPYIASQFRKDRIWLRRTKPSKRQYQIMVAVDDSSSMVFNHSKQLAFESLAVLSNALTKLEVGELSVCSFGESVKVIHPLSETFNAQSGANILQQFTFEQKRTSVTQLLSSVTSMMVASRSRQRINIRLEASQLLLIISDGRMQESLDSVASAIRTAQQAHVFVVFIILDNPDNKDSILDIRQPNFASSGEITFVPYMDVFPFPFYIVLRDVNALPHTISDALRQWFELVTAGDL